MNKKGEKNWILVIIFIGISFFAYSIISEPFLYESYTDNDNSDYYLEVIDSEDCEANWYDCDDFDTQEDAQYLWEYCGEDDIHNLDGDDDGIACETLP